MGKNFAPDGNFAPALSFKRKMVRINFSFVNLIFIQQIRYLFNKLDIHSTYLIFIQHI